MAFPSLKNFTITPDSAAKATEWFKQKVRDLHATATFHGVGHSRHNIPLPGHMFLFHYDAKLKDKLPYWDRYPLVLPFNVQSDRFWGLNLHYLPYEYRVLVLAALNKLVVDSKISEQKRMELSWALLRESMRIKYIRPCVHQYLLQGNHVQSKFLMIDSDEWIAACLLPVEDFAKAKKPGTYTKFDKRQVWNDSLK